MAELADALDLGSSGRPCRFDSCYPHNVESGESFKIKGSPLFHFENLTSIMIVNSFLLQLWRILCKIKEEALMNGCVLLLNAGRAVFLMLPSVSEMIFQFPAFITQSADYGKRRARFRYHPEKRMF